MPIAVTEDHESLRTTALRWAQTHSPATVPREAAEAPPGSADLPAAWEKMAAQGWLGLHLPEDQGGQGFTLSELAVVVEELGHGRMPRSWSLRGRRVLMLEIEQETHHQ